MKKFDVGFRILQNLGKIQRGQVSVELNFMQWGFYKPTFDLRPWEQGEGETKIPWKGITLSKDELRKLRDILNELSLEDEESGGANPEQKKMTAS